MQDKLLVLDMLKHPLPVPLLQPPLGMQLLQQPVSLFGMLA